METTGMQAIEDLKGMATDYLKDKPETPHEFCYPNKVELRRRDPDSPVDSANTEVYLNGQLLAGVTAFNYGLDAGSPVTSVTLTFMSELMIK